MDGGPQFRSEFSQFCEQNGIRHELASPYNPRANGLAESVVKVVKDLLLKCMGEKGDMQRILYEWRNMPKSHGFSPAQLLFGRSQNMLLPQPLQLSSLLTLMKLHWQEISCLIAKLTTITETK